MLWQFPIGSHQARGGREELIKAWDQLHGDRAAEQMLRQLVLALRMWRPDVLITDRPDDPTANSAADGLLAEAVREAFQRAEDPKAFPEQLQDLGLQPWKASKLYACWENSRDNQVTLDLTEVRPALHGTLQEFAAGTAAQLAEHAVMLPNERSFRLLADRLGGAANDHDLMQGIALAPGGLARRPLSTATAPTEEEIKAIRQRSNLRHLAQAPSNTLTNPERLLAQIGPMLEHMPEDQAAPAAYAVASQYVQLGQWNLAREAFQLVVDRYPTHPAALDAYRWLLRHNSSSEAKRRHELGQFLIVQQQKFGIIKPVAHDDTPVEPEPFEGPRSEDGKGKKIMKRATPPQFEDHTLQAMALVASKGESRKWYESSLEIEPRLKTFGPLFVNDPSIQFCLQAARRQLGDVETPKSWYSQFMAKQPDGPWRSAAAAELWLLNRSGPPPKPVMICRHTDTRPYLDGKLDDPCWQGGHAFKLTNAAGETLADCPTEVRMAYDQEFLYLAVRCVHPAEQHEEPAKVRSRDADLRRHDRVSLMLDLDRDYATCFHLQVDQRGCVCDDCWGDRTWDPRWFVAVHKEPTVWVVEAAIPMTALTGDHVTPGKAWAVNVVRVLPGRGVQAWSLPAEAPEESQRLEGMGLLLFTQDPSQKPANRETMTMSRVK
jgi:tetratricopeptide (TPR) repeat protein